MTAQSARQKNEKCQIVSQQGRTEGYQTREQSETVLLKGMLIDTSMSGLDGGAIRTYTEAAPSITAREYKEPRMILE